MDTKRDLQNPSLNRYLRGMDQRERNLQRKRRRQLKRIVRETVICITAGALMAGALTYAFLNDTYQPPAQPEQTYWNGMSYTPQEYEAMMSERSEYLQKEGIPE